MTLARFVAEKLGGPVDREELAAFSWELPLAMIRKEINANIIPLGLLKKGTFFHRALLYKVRHHVFLRFPSLKVCRPWVLCVELNCIIQASKT